MVEGGSLKEPRTRHVSHDNAFLVFKGAPHRAGLRPGALSPHLHPNLQSTADGKSLGADSSSTIMFPGALFLRSPRSLTPRLVSGALQSSSRSAPLLPTPFLSSACEGGPDCFCEYHFCWENSDCACHRCYSLDGPHHEISWTTREQSPYLGARDVFRSGSLLKRPAPNSGDDPRRAFLRSSSSSSASSSRPQLKSKPG